MGVLLALVSSGPAYAADPTQPAPPGPAPVWGTGIDTSRARTWTAEELGYTNEYAASKDAAFQKWAAANAAQVDGSLSDGAAPMLPSAISLSGWVAYHQKYSWWCMDAVLESMLHQSLGGWNTPSVLSVQTTIANAVGTHPAPDPGTDDYTALAWVNGVYSPSGWFYLAVKDTSLSAFQNRLMYEVSTLLHALYVRVDLASNKFMWYQAPDQYGNHPLHATAAQGYSYAGADSRVNDPFTTKNSDGTCNAAWDSGSANMACVWGIAGPLFTTSNYYLSMDPTAFANSEYPEWY
jgi:hypothetical protein